MLKRKILSTVIFVLSIVVFGLSVSSSPQTSNTRTAQSKAKPSTATGQGNWSGRKPQGPVVLYLPAGGKPVTVPFEQQGLKDFKAAVKKKNTVKIDEYIDFVFFEFEKAGIECCEPRTKLSGCVWVCCDGSKVDTCKNKTLTEVVTRIFPAEPSPTDG